MLAELARESYRDQVEGCFVSTLAAPCAGYVPTTDAPVARIWPQYPPLLMMYTPNPLDTATVVLPPDLMALTERLAENTHEVWAKARLEQGWTYGPTRDDGAKTHPCLIPYAALPESEKVYDRNTATETLRAIIVLGYTIRPAGN
jgi:ryanodine receptor 2